MSVAADVVRVTLSLAVLAGGVVLLRYTWFFVWSWWELVEPVVTGLCTAASLGRRLFGVMVIGVGLWIVRVGDRIVFVPMEVINE